MDRESWKISQYNFYKGNYSAISPEQLPMYQRWDRANKESRTLSYVFVGGMAAPLAAVGVAESGATYYIYQGSLHLIRGSMLERISNIAGDLTFQLASNGFSFGDLNLTSLGASFLLPNAPYLNAALGSAGQFSINDRFKNSLLGQKTAGQILFETGAGGFFGALGNRASNNQIFQKMYGRFGSNYIPDYLGNMIPGVGSLIYEQATKPNE